MRESYMHCGTCNQVLGVVESKTKNPFHNAKISFLGIKFVQHGHDGMDYTGNFKALIKAVTNCIFTKEEGAPMGEAPKI